MRQVSCKLSYIRIFYFTLLPTYADNVSLPAFACRKPLLLRAGQQSIDICPPGPQQQTRGSDFAVVDPFWDRQTDGTVSK